MSKKMKLRVIPNTNNEYEVELISGENKKVGFPAWVSRRIGKAFVVLLIVSLASSSFYTSTKLLDKIDAQNTAEPLVQTVSEQPNAEISLTNSEVKIKGGFKPTSTISGNISLFYKVAFLFVILSVPLAIIVLACFLIKDDSAIRYEKLDKLSEISDFLSELNFSESNTETRTSIGGNNPSKTETSKSIKQDLVNHYTNSISEI